MQNSGTALNFLLLDDHNLFLKGLHGILTTHFNDCNTSLYSSIKQLEDDKLDFDQFDMMVSDMELDNENVFILLERIKKHHNLPILVISMHKKLSLLKKCKALGVEGYILKNDDELLIEALETILSGETFYSPLLLKLLKDSEEQNITLSEREEEVIAYICKGASNRDISVYLNISVETVKTHKKNIKEKLGLYETQQIIEYANKNILF